MVMRLPWPSKELCGFPRGRPLPALPAASSGAGDLPGDFKRQLKGRGCLLTGDFGLAPLICSFNKRSELQLQRFLVFDGDPVANDLLSQATVNFAGLILVIERQVRVFLKNADLSDALGTDAAGSYIRHAAIFEMQPGISDIFSPA